ESPVARKNTIANSNNVLPNLRESCIGHLGWIENRQERLNLVPAGNASKRRAGIALFFSLQTVGPAHAGIQAAFFLEPGNLLNSKIFSTQEFILGEAVFLKR